VSECPRCGADVARADKLCRRCGFVLDSGPRAFSPEDDIGTERPDNIRTGPEPPDNPTCPRCGTRIYLGDPACATCGQLLCPRCGTPADPDKEEANPERCPGCDLALTFACPECGMELLAGAGMCPDCGLVFIRRCPTCGESLFHAPDRCPHCDQAVIHQQRPTARSLSRRVGTLLVRWVACPVCRTQFVPSAGVCPGCGSRLCGECHLLLLPEETTCPRCGFELTVTCPNCNANIAPGGSECTACGQPLCPACGAAVGENDTACASCSTELELVCSECGGPVGPHDTTCTHCGAPFDTAV
jgi:predicted amidophosphoribosyltransferase